MDKNEHDRLAKLGQTEKNSAIGDACDVIHRSVNSGTTDRDAVNAALEIIAACTEKAETKPAANPLPTDATYRAPGVTDAPSIQAPQSPAQP